MVRNGQRGVRSGRRGVRPDRRHDRRHLRGADPARGRTVRAVLSPDRILSGSPSSALLSHLGAGRKMLVQGLIVGCFGWLIE